MTAAQNCGNCGATPSKEATFGKLWGQRYALWII